ncbi:MAG TPA: PocR ligand-binding domain-containing protein [bacterium]|nr:PocR ligand-binding domain-containing protein [bacterium]
MSALYSKTLLLVEDDAIIALAEKKQLEDAGYRVIHCLSGESALDLLRDRKEPADLVLMDINLGKGMNGTETARRILKDINLPILFLSSHTEREIVEKTESITNYGYVVKNSSITVLDASIKMAFRLFDASTSIQKHQTDLVRAQEEMIRINATLQDSERNLIKSESSVRNKLKAILEPEGSIGSLELSDIIDARSIQSLMDDFYKLTGILGAILDMKGNILVAAGWQDICTKFHRCNPITAQHCKESDLTLTQGVKEGTFKIYRCKNNMWDMVTPLVIDNVHIGNIFIGQFIFDDEEPDVALYRNQAREYGFNEKEYLEALDSVPRFNRETVDTGMSFYAKVAKMISSLSYSSVKLARAIAERKTAEENVRNLLTEKELILKEVHHRIKNNMSTMSSLLSLQARSARDRSAAIALQDAGNRIRSMYILYDKLYQSSDFSELSVKDYLSSLVDDVVASFPNSQMVEIEKDFPDFPLDVKRLQPLGIIINELLTNTMKYAFGGKERGLITVSATKYGNRVVAFVQDDGCGFPASVSFDSSTGFGLQLVHALAEQLDGTIRMEQGVGTKVVLEFES